MFDDLNPQNDKQQNNAPTPPPSQAPIQDVPPKKQASIATDMFSDTDPVKEKPKQFQGIENTQPTELSTKDGESFQKIFMLAIIILGVVLIAIGGYWAFKMDSGNEVEVVEENNDQIGHIQNNPLEGEGGVTSSTQPINQADKKIDADQDGLTDEEEQALGLNSTLVDTDGDGLFDREEVKVYKTDPLNKDTDGDGVMDGEEVKNSQNPKGEGSLFSLEQAIGTKDNSTTIPPVDSTVKPVADIDTDGDGLTDKEELEIYNTDPAVQDTDGDGYNDGDEVKNGFNPKGAGKLSS